MSTPLTKMLASPDKLINEARDEITRLFRRILADLKVSPMQWRELMEAYLDNPILNIPKTVRDRSTERGNLNKKLSKPTMTWDVFKRGLIFLGVQAARFEVQLHWRKGRTTLHSMPVNLLGSEPVVPPDPEDKKAARNELAYLFRQILVDVKVPPNRWNELMVRYLDNPRNGIPNTVRDRSTARGNLNKDLQRPTMTWKVFSKGIVFLSPKGFTLEVTLEWKDREPTVHRVSLELDQ